MNQPEFPTVFRGYDPVQVDQHVAALQQAADAARQEAAASTVELTKLRQSHEALSQELDGQRRSLGELEEQARKVSSPTFADLGERIGSMLGLADEEAASIRAAAAAEVEQARHAADEDAALVRAEADRYAEEVRTRADVDASEAVSRAKQEADSIIDDAAREAAARREEAEAYYEKQRATAAASAADFERTLGERREKSAAEFTAQMAQQDQALAAVQERADLLGREAEDDRQHAAAEASRTLEAARTEAAALVGSAKEQADRIRRDSERELAAATARRDSITAQLSNVRNMLATLGGGAAVGLPAEDEHPAARGRGGPRRGPRRRGRGRGAREAEVEPPRSRPRSTPPTRVRGREVEAVDGEHESAQRASRSRRRREEQAHPRRRAGTEGPTRIVGGPSEAVEVTRRRAAVEGHDTPGAGLDLGHVWTGRRHSSGSDRGHDMPGDQRGSRARSTRRTATTRRGRAGPRQSRGRTASQTACATTSLDAGPTWVASSDPRRSRCTVLSSCPKVLSVPTSLTTSRSQPLRASLARAWSSTDPSSSPVSAAKPTMTGERPLPRAATSPASTSGLRTSSTIGADSSAHRRCRPRASS